MSLHFFSAGVAAALARREEEMVGTQSGDKVGSRSVEESTRQG